MPDHLVTTKLLVPRPRARAVARGRLDELLGRRSDATLTLVSAPAGFGKTTMRVSHLSVDSTNRTWIGEVPTYLPPVGIGEVMRALGVGQVVASNNPAYTVGSFATG
jgi:NADPH-dependent curcumin reductase CurA